MQWKCGDQFYFMSNYYLLRWRYYGWNYIQIGWIMNFTPFYILSADESGLEWKRFVAGGDFVPQWEQTSNIMKLLSLLLAAFLNASPLQVDFWNFFIRCTIKHVIRHIVFPYILILNQRNHETWNMKSKGNLCWTLLIHRLTTILRVQITIYLNTTLIIKYTL